MFENDFSIDFSILRLRSGKAALEMTHYFSIDYSGDLAMISTNGKELRRQDKQD
jgi:hypothetical protein